MGEERLPNNWFVSKCLSTDVVQSNLSNSRLVKAVWRVLFSALVFFLVCSELSHKEADLFSCLALSKDVLPKAEPSRALLSSLTMFC